MAANLRFLLMCLLTVVAFGLTVSSALACPHHMMQRVAETPAPASSTAVAVEQTLVMKEQTGFAETTANPNSLRPAKELVSRVNCHNKSDSANEFFCCHAVMVTPALTSAPEPMAEIGNVWKTKLAVMQLAQLQTTLSEIVERQTGWSAATDDRPWPPRVLSRTLRLRI